jgi:hypothetical protein
MTPFRWHLKEHHALVWAQECARLKIPVPVLEQELLDQTRDISDIKPFTREGLMQHLVKFVAGDDQV